MNQINTLKSNKFPHFVPAFILALVIFLDQLSKYWLVNKLDLINRKFIDVYGFLDFTMVWNYGVSFGIFQANSTIGRWALVGFTAIIVVMFFIWLLRAQNPLSQTALSFIIGGAIGNMIDRIRFGAVADFIDFSPIFPWVFNVADCAVVFGAMLLALDLFISPDDKDKSDDKDNLDDKENLPNNNVESN
jgi:signal peptidase II